ncbi:MAG: BlaI/MecI/CopY family transcriptional regulator [Terriglobales bacterium]
MNPTRRSRLAQLELECMKVLWEQPGASVAQVRSALDRQLAYTTVMTVLDRMTAKGVVTRRKNGRAWYYAAQLDRETARVEAVDRLLANLFDDNRTELVEYLSRRRITRRPSGSASRGTAASAVSSPPRTTRVARPLAAGPRRRTAKAQPAFIPGFLDESLL